MKVFRCIISIVLICSLLLVNQAGAKWEGEVVPYCDDNYCREIALDVEDDCVQRVVQIYENATGAELNKDNPIKLTKHFIVTTQEAQNGTVICDYYSLMKDGEVADFCELANRLRSGYTASTCSATDDELEVQHYVRYDFWWSFTVYFTYATNQSYRFYRPYRIDGSWAPKSGNTVSMNSFSMNYVSRGWLVSSPACLDTSLTYNELEALVTNYYCTHTVPILSSNVPANTILTNTVYLPSGSALWFALPMSFHGSSVMINCQYTCNGNSYTGSLEAILGAYYI